MQFTLIISTLGRTAELTRLFESLANQSLQDFEIIISDQNKDDRLDPIIQNAGLKQKIIHLKSDGGLSRARNAGLVHATGDIVGFPDDDCVYPPDVLAKAAAFFASHQEYGLLSGCSYADDRGGSISRFAKEPAEIEKLKIHTQCIEFATFMRRSALGDLRYDENMGVGSRAPWHSDEGPDLILRLQRAGVRCFYDPGLTVWHAKPIVSYGPKEIDRGYRYALGTGYFYRKHRYPSWYFMYYMSRTLAGAVLSLVTLKRAKANFYFARCVGMWRGWLSTPIPDGIPAT